MGDAEVDAPNPLASLWAQAQAIQNVKSIIPVTLDLTTPNFTKWCTFFHVAVTQYALADHLDTEVPPADDEEWLRLDATVLRWLYGSISFDILDLVMEGETTAYKVWTSIIALFRDNQKARAMYLGKEFRNLEQGDRSIADYCHKQKTVADALADVGAPVTDEQLVYNTLKGLDEDFEHIATLVPMLTPFPSFLQLRSMLLLHELKPKTSRSSSAAALHTSHGGSGSGQQHGRNGAPASYGGGGAPAAYGSSGGAPAAYGHGTGSSSWKKKKKGRGGPPAAYGGGGSYHGTPSYGGSGSYGAPHYGGGGGQPWPSVFNPWTGTIQMHPMAPRHGSPAGILGPRPGAPRAAAHGYMASPTPAYHPSFYPAPPSSSATWDPSALINQFSTMSLQQPATDWDMDTGATAHMSADAGPSNQGRDYQVQ